MKRAQGAACNVAQATGFCVLAVSSVALGAPGDTTLVSVHSNGAEGNGQSYPQSMSADGRYVAFFSWARNLVDNDTNGFPDVFVHDRQTRLTTRVSVSSSGAQSNNDSQGASISADGRYVVFQSNASNLFDGDTNEVYDVFVHDRQTGLTTRVNVSSSGEQAGNSTYSYIHSQAISADGRYVVFDSDGSSLVDGDTNGSADVFLHDRQTGVTSRISVSSSGVQGNDHSDSASVSADGRYVVFQSRASNLVDGDTNGWSDVFLHDRQTGVTSRVSVDSNGVQSGGSLYSSTISADGRYVAFNAFRLGGRDEVQAYVYETNASPADGDGDGAADSSDNCPTLPNRDQADLDGDGIGDACDADIDGDGMSNDFESTYGLNPYDPADAAADADLDGLTNLQESRLGTNPLRSDTDGDGYADGADNCPTVANDQADGDGDGIGDACDSATPPDDPVLSIDRSAGVSFEPSVVGQPAKPETITITNTGTGRLVGSCKTSAPFAATVDPFYGCVFDLGARESREIRVDFTPNAPNPFARYLFIETNAGSVSVPLVGLGVSRTEPPASPPTDGRTDLWGIFIGLNDQQGMRGDEEARELREAIHRNLGVPLSRLKLRVNTSESGSFAFVDSTTVRGVIEETVREMRAHGGKTLLFFVSTHGSTEGFSAGIGAGPFEWGEAYDYTSVPEDRKDEVTLSAGDEYLALDGADRLHDDQLKDWLAAAAAEGIQLWIILDSCHSGGFWGRIPDDNPLSPEGDLSRLPNIGFIAASAEDRYAAYSGYTGRSWLTSGLIAAFARGEDGRLSGDLDSDGTLSLEELYRSADSIFNQEVYRFGGSLDAYPVGFKGFLFSTERTTLDRTSFAPVMYASADFAGRLAGSPMPDSDADGVLDDVDNCPNTPNVDQRDSNGDGIGDACDASPPAIAPLISGTRGSNDWFTSDVSVSWNVADAESAVTSRIGCGAEVVSADTSGQTFSCTAISAGGTASASVTVKRDASPPTLVFGAPSPAANDAGWHKSGVEIPYTTEDATSGVASSAPVSPVVVSIQGNGVTQTVTVTDNAGNSATLTTPAVNIDGTVPAVSIASPSDGASYLKNGQLFASYSCSDAVSGIARCEGPVANGASIDTSAEGDFNFPVTAEDRAGNSNSKTHRYSIVMRYSFGGFFAPVDNPPTVNAVKAGRTVPVKWSLMSGEGQLISDLSTFRSLTSQPVACLSGAPVDAVEESVTAGTSGLRYDAESQQFIYNWKTSSAWAGTCRRMVLDLADGQSREAVFRLQ